MPESCCVILTTVGSQDEAQGMADVLVSRKLAACVQIVDIASTYRWKGELQHDNEHLLLIKTSAHLYQQVETAIVENHSYDVPEVVQLPIVGGLKSYLDWITENTV
jgi:periplasmic divalent cation tolerance protein